MKVGLDATPLAAPVGGIRRYTAELMKAMRAQFPEDEILEVADGGGRWWSRGLPGRLRRERFDLFHGTDFAVPYLPLVASVMTVHDLSPWRPELAGETSDRVRRRTPWLLRLGLATMVITPTQAVRREVLERFGLSTEEVVAVPEAAGEQFRPLEPGPVSAPYFLHIGSPRARKNVGVIEQACRHLGVELRRGPVEEAELPGVYAGAIALLFPSLYEGFGLPMLEAMQTGTPVIASRDAALLEVSGGAALHAEADDPAAWIERMEAVWKRPHVRASLREAGLRRAAHFSWARTARETREVYRTALRRFHG